MKISVIVTTFNGEKYIEEQLLSILRQTRQPDEVLISDDCSSDGTESIVKRFIEKNGLAEKAWHLKINDHNMGLWSNSHQTVMRSRGDILFWSDQHDVWLPDKIKQMAGFMESESNALALSSRYFLVDSDLRRLKGLFVDNREGTGATTAKSLKYVLNTRNLAAQSLAVRRDLYEEILLKYDDPYIFFDTMIISYAAAKGSYYLMDMPLTLYRQHDSNCSGFIYGLGFMKKEGYSRPEAIRPQIKMMETRNIILSEFLSGTDKGLLAEALQVAKKRLHYVEERKIISLTGMLFSSNPYVNKKWIIADLLYLLLR